jgi:lysophospholipase L1-like esterase
VVVSSSPSFALPTDHKLRVVSLGDSVAAGEGTDHGGGNGCRQSEVAWPAQLAQTIGADFTQLACTGASLGNGILGASDPNSVAAQHVQYPLLEPLGADIVTLQVGANDVDFLGAVAQCYLGDCVATTNVQATTARIDAFRKDLMGFLTQLRQPGGRIPLVIVSTYYYPFMEPCAATPGLTREEIDLLRSQEDQLNQAITSAVTDARDPKRPDQTRYVDNSATFARHDACSASPDIFPFPSLDPLQTPLHPTLQGQNALADAALAIVRA